MSLNLDNLYFRMTSNSASESHCLSWEVKRNLFFGPVSLGVCLKYPVEHGRTAPHGLVGLCHSTIYFKYTSAESPWFRSPLSNISVKRKQQDEAQTPMPVAQSLTLQLWLKRRQLNRWLLWGWGEGGGDTYENIQGCSDGDVKYWGKRARETPDCEDEDGLIGVSAAFLQQHDILWKWKNSNPLWLPYHPDSNKLDLTDEILEVFHSSFYI